MVDKGILIKLMMQRISEEYPVPRVSHSLNLIPFQSKPSLVKNLHGSSYQIQFNEFKEIEMKSSTMRLPFLTWDKIGLLLGLSHGCQGFRKRQDQNEQSWKQKPLEPRSQFPFNIEFVKPTART